MTWLAIALMFLQGLVFNVLLWVARQRDYSNGFRHGHAQGKHEADNFWRELQRKGVQPQAEKDRKSA